MKRSKTDNNIDLSVNDANTKLTANQKITKILKCLKQTPSKITVKECSEHSLPIIKAPFHKIDLYLDTLNFDKIDFVKKIKLSKYHVHVPDKVIYTENGPVHLEYDKINSGKISEYAHITVFI